MHKLCINRPTGRCFTYQPVDKGSHEVGKAVHHVDNARHIVDKIQLLRG